MVKRHSRANRTASPIDSGRAEVLIPIKAAAITARREVSSDYLAMQHEEESLWSHSRPSGRFLLATTETMAAPVTPRVVITKMKGRFFMGTLLSSQSISDCNFQLCISDVIVVTETTILLNFYADTLAVGLRPQSGH